MSLAEELLADLEDAGDFEEDQLYQQDAHIQEVEDVMPLEVDTKSKSVRAIAKLRDSEELAHVMNAIKEKKEHGRKEEVIGPVEADPEYQLIVEANNLAVEIDNEINIIHKFTRDNYSKRFPELESLVPGALDYMSTVKELGNSLEKAKNNEMLQQFLTPATIMVVSVTASTTQGQLLSPEELATIFEACDMALDLNDFKLEIYSYVESRMSFIAPNLSAIVGASVAAKLMGVAGGLTNLSKMPACNVLVLGSQKRTLSGFSSTAVMPHTGFVYYTDIVQNTPAVHFKGFCSLFIGLSRLQGAFINQKGSVELQRLLYNCSIFITPRYTETLGDTNMLDSTQVVADCHFAALMADQVIVKAVKGQLIWRTPAQANRMTFGEIEEDAYQDDLGFSSGHIGKAGTGRIRAAQVDEKTKVRISKTLQKNLQRQQVYGGSTTVRRQVSGTASSVAFTPLQGLEIVNPHAAETRAGDSGAKYFSNTAGFLKLQKN
ncbi:U4/U6 small nuclear ribonucleoprotein Prp31, putative [Ixodes scapularis]|uniref:U4/U6 small nuclear ribonucleoprotein Prp31 n=1 Tax=Ixodes scapularis TaxID=6945 RepID=B7QFR1_IXOSC|nr:U4/U6 small nuclear ribonucleoprotein Prp31, putative [Ixodes scapularis]|eukprot:XP_002414375.1 U4/U6 small nuclear ribonucleoprotein Prp31, putative [Ixodes scapularis]